MEKFCMIAIRGLFIAYAFTILWFAYDILKSFCDNAIGESWRYGNPFKAIWTIWYRICAIIAMLYTLFGAFGLVF